MPQPFGISTPAGLASVAVLSSAFPAQAAFMGDVLGLAPPALFVPHPISDQSDAALVARADAVGDAVLAALTTAAPVVPRAQPAVLVAAAS